MTFSKLDFEDVHDDPIGTKMFTFLYKSYNPVRQSIAFLPRKRRHKICDTRTVIKHYKVEGMIDSINGLIANARKAQQKNIPQWEKYIKLIEGLSDDKCG